MFCFFALLPVTNPKKQIFRKQKQIFGVDKKRILGLQKPQDKLYWYQEITIGSQVKNTTDTTDAERIDKYGKLRTEIKTGFLLGKSAF